MPDPYDLRTLHDTPPAEEPGFAVHGTPSETMYARLRRVAQAQALRQLEQDAREKRLRETEEGLVRRVASQEVRPLRVVHFHDRPEPEQVVAAWCVLGFAVLLVVGWLWGMR